MFSHKRRWDRGPYKNKVVNLNKSLIKVTVPKVHISWYEPKLESSGVDAAKRVKFW